MCTIISSNSSRSTPRIPSSNIECSETGGCSKNEFNEIKSEMQFKIWWKRNGVDGINEIICSLNWILGTMPVDEFSIWCQCKMTKSKLSYTDHDISLYQSTNKSMAWNCSRWKTTDECIYVNWIATTILHNPHIAVSKINALLCTFAWHYQRIMHTRRSEDFSCNVSISKLDFRCNHCFVCPLHTFI